MPFLFVSFPATVPSSFLSSSPIIPPSHLVYAVRQAESDYVKFYDYTFSFCFVCEDVN